MSMSRTDLDERNGHDSSALNSWNRSIDCPADWTAAKAGDKDSQIDIPMDSPMNSNESDGSTGWHYENLLVTKTVVLRNYTEDTENFSSQKVRRRSNVCYLSPEKLENDHRTRRTVKANLHTQKANRNINNCWILESRNCR